MKESSYKSYDELPLFLNAATVAKVLGVSPSSGYELIHEPDFPVLKVGCRMVVPKDKFVEWVSQLTRTPSRGQRKNIKIFHSTAVMLYCGNWKFG